MDAGTLVVIASIITTLTGLVIGVLTHLSSSQKAAMTGLQDTLRLLQEENKRLTARIEQGEAEERASDKRIDDLKCEIDKIHDAREAAQRERDEMKRSLDRLTRELEKTEQQRDSLQVKLYDMEHKTIPAMQLEINTLRRMVTDLGGKPPTGPL